jgi:prepilin-type processing-associated H-X9-DG protein
MTQTPLTHRPLHGFTAVELLVLSGIVVILLSIFVPYLLSIRESSRRTACQQNLMRLRDALGQYAAENGQVFPRVVYDEAGQPDSYVAYTGADSSDPFAVASLLVPATQATQPAEPATRAVLPANTVAPNDVTASLWLLVRLDLIRPDEMVCPSGSARADPLLSGGRPVPAVQRGNFSGPGHLGYSYSSPFSSAAGYRMSADFLLGGFVVMADISPGNSGDDDAVTGPSHDASLSELAQANSNNHGGAGQNVLYADGHAAFHSTPYCGVEQDNIYTALSPKPLEPGQSPPANGRGYLGRSVAPAWNGDSYLVPTDDER